MKPNIFANPFAYPFANQRATLVALACVLSLLPSAYALDPPSEPADKILVSNHVVTMATSHPSPAKRLAVAIQGERISWVGSPDDMQEHVGAQTEVIELGDQALLPGFIDAHGHLPGSAAATTLANVASPPVGNVQTMADLQQELRDYAAANNIEKGDWIVGRGYDDSLIAEGRHPNRDDLDEVSTDNPIALVHVSGHLAAANSRALARVGYTGESIDPPGGVIRRRRNSTEPDGVLEESAAAPLRAYMGEVDKDPFASMQSALTEYASFGITTAQDGASSPPSIELMRQVAAKGDLIMDVVAYPVGMGGVASVDYEFGRYDNGLKIGGVKLFLDGSPQGKTAYLSSPYHVPPQGQDEQYRGYPSAPQNVFDSLLTEFLGAEIPVLAHANGDAAAQMLIDAVENADASHDHRTVMIHAQTVREDQITRMKSLGMVPSYFSAHTFYWGDWHRDSVLGEVRGRRISPTASTIQRGMIFTVHNDAPVVPADMPRLLWATTNRQTRSGKTLGPEQRVSTYDALRAITIFAAYQNFEESSKGSIEVGKQADLVVLNKNPLAMKTMDLLDLQAMATYSRGEQIYSRN